MPYSGKEKGFSVLVYTITQLNKNVQRAFVRRFAKNAPTVAQIWTWHKKINGHVQGKRIWMTTSIGRDGRTGSGNNFTKPQQIPKRKSGNLGESQGNACELHHRSYGFFRP